MPIRLKVSVLSPVSSFSSPYKGQRTGLEKPDPRCQTSSSLHSSIDIRSSASAACPVMASHCDQQSVSLLADGAIGIVLTHLLVVGRALDWDWEWHGKIEPGATEALARLRPPFFNRRAEIDPVGCRVGPNSASRPINDVPSKHTAAITPAREVQCIAFEAAF